LRAVKKGNYIDAESSVSRFPLSDSPPLGRLFGKAKPTTAKRVAGTLRPEAGEGGILKSNLFIAKTSSKTGTREVPERPAEPDRHCPSVPGGRSCGPQMVSMTVRMRILACLRIRKVG